MRSSFKKYHLVSYFSRKSGKIIPVIVLIFLPSIFLVINFFSPEIDDFLRTYMPFSVEFYLLFIIEFASIFIMLGIYAPYPVTRSMEKYIVIRGYENTILEYLYVKKILHYAVPLFIFVTVIFSLHPWLLDNLPVYATYSSYIPRYQLDLEILQVALFFIVLSGIFKILSLILRKDFRFYFAKGCFKIISEEVDEIEKMKYLMLALGSYNLYLRRHLKVQINDVKSIYSKIISENLEKRNKIIRELSSAFEGDELEPLDFLSKFIKVPGKEVPGKEEFLVEQPIGEKIKTIGAALAIIIPAFTLLIKDLPEFLKGVHGH